jgi:N-acetyl-gamma-glutamyl-phosphate reductase
VSRPRIYVDGQSGTTGLRIHALLAARGDLEVLRVAEARRRDPAARRELLDAADLVLLCLPDDAAREAVALIGSSATRVIDASTAHRVDPGWVFGLPELEPGQRDAIRSARRVSNPGCYPTGVVLLLRPLLEAGLVPRNAPIAIHALSGYSGGGRALIEKWEAPGAGLLGLPFEAPYALERTHKHVPEMHRYSGLVHAPQFTPAVGPFRCGMRVEIPLPASLLAPGATAKRCHEALEARYAGEPFVRVAAYAEPPDYDDRSFDPRACNDTNRIDLCVLPNPAGHVLLFARYDNLGKGAAGAAVQNLNLMLGLDERTGLEQPA